MENLDDKKILDGFIGVLLPWTALNYPRVWLSSEIDDNTPLNPVKLSCCYEYQAIPDLRFEFP